MSIPGLNEWLAYSTAYIGLVPQSILRLAPVLEVDSGCRHQYLHRRYLEVVMKTRVQRWGNSLALRIPKSYAAEAGLCENGPVELSLVKGSLVVKRAKPAAPTLGELLRGITDDNMPTEWDTGPAVGKEVW
jgi:antitoxin MazE